MAGFLPSQADCDPVQNILEWQSQQLQVQPTDYVEEAAGHNVIASLSGSLISLFRAIIPELSGQQQTPIPQTARISLERSCSALFLWCDGYGIPEGRLNDAFNRSGKLRCTTLKNLLHIGRVLVERLLPLVHVSEKLQALCSSVESNIEEAAGIIAEGSSRQSDDSSSDAASDFSNDDIHEIAEDLRTDTLILSSLDPLLKYPIFDTQLENAADGQSVSAWSPEKLFSDRIEHRFPSAATSLASRLGRANYERYLRCQATRDAQERALSLPVMAQEAQDKAGTIIADSKFHDSGVGTSLGASLAPTVSYAETTMSYNHDGQSVRIPPLSKEAKSGLPFTCVACGRTVVITNNSGWKRHIYLDLQPYMCLNVLCPHSSSTFDSREKWIAHLALDHEMEPHWKSSQCALCKEQTGSGKMAVTMHLSKHLEEISLSALPVEISSNAASEDTSELTDISSSVQDLSDVDTLEPYGDTRTCDRPLNGETLRLAAAQSDTEAAVRSLSNQDDLGNSEAMIAVARQGHYLALQQLLGLSGANPDPSPVATLPADVATPMLAAIGQNNIKVIELLLKQTNFNPTRAFRGETYYEIARQRQGPNWEKEEHLLRTAYDDYKRTHITLADARPIGTSTGPDGAPPKDLHADQQPRHQHPDTSASFLPDNSLANEEPASQTRSPDMLETHPRSYKCSFCDKSFTGVADRYRHTQSQHIEEAKDYHGFLATVKAQFKDQPDKYTRFLNILAVILRGPCGRCMMELVTCDAKFPSPCSACRHGQLPCVVIARTTPRRFIKHL
ncbi:hypothetical protein HDV57DRAFT_509264 [Trichoderma longibrachiatum]